MKKFKIYLDFLTNFVIATVLMLIVFALAMFIVYATIFIIVDIKHIDKNINLVHYQTGLIAAFFFWKYVLKEFHKPYKESYLKFKKYKEENNNEEENCD